MILFYIAFLNPFTLKTFGPGILIVIIPFIYFIKNTFIHMYRKSWTLCKEDLHALKPWAIQYMHPLFF